MYKSFVNTNSTHNILQPRIATHLQLPTTTISQFSVMVGNGSISIAIVYAPNVTTTLEATLFHLPFYLLPVVRDNVVLGMEWLRPLNQYMQIFQYHPSRSPTITLTSP